MSNPFSSALSYLGGHVGGKVSEGGSRFVGQLVDLGGEKKLRVKKVIAEGGYGYVFVAQDNQTGTEYALKRQVVPKENVKMMKREIAYLKQLGDHPHIINYVASAGIPPSQTSHGNAEFLIQTELCSGGQMQEVLRCCHLNSRQVIRVFYALCSAVAHMHSQHPPIIHRDLKVENVLLTAEGVIKLCDFGSATTQQLNPNSSWTAVQRGLVEDEIHRNTTPMYRSPEMVDLYSNKPVTEKADVWALGCLLYLLCYRSHPFEGSGKLQIINANYKIPESDSTFTMFHGIIGDCLVVDPALRPSVDAVLAQLYSIADQLGENMERPSMDLISLVRESPSSQGALGEEGVSNGVGGAMGSTLQSTSQQAHRLFGYMKDGAGSLFKNFKESSSKAIIAMSAAAPKRPGLDITYVTSRIIAMSYPHDDAFHGHHMAEVRSFLDERHPSAYLVFNLSENTYDPSKLSNRVYDFAWPHRGVPELEKMVDLCCSMDAWLRDDSRNVIVVHCNDGKSITPVAVVAYMLFLGAVSSPYLGLDFVALKRRPEAPTVAGTPSQIRYLNYLAGVVGQSPCKPHNCKLTITMLRLSTVPLFNAIRTGCKPFVEVYQEGERVYTSATHDSMDSIRSFHVEDKCVGVPLGITVQGNITINVYHIRAIPVARKAGVGLTAVKMFFFHFHTGFMNIQQTSFAFDRKTLDGSSVRKKEKFPPPFQAVLDGEWDTSLPGVYQKASWLNLPYPKTSPLTCFSSVTEQGEVLKQLDPQNASSISCKLPEIPTTPTTPSSHIIYLYSQHPPAEGEREECSSAGSGILLNMADKRDDQFVPNAEHGIQFEWHENQNTAKFGGYVPFHDQIPDVKSHSDSRNSSSGSSDDEEFSDFRGIIFGNVSGKLKKKADTNGALFANLEAARLNSHGKQEGTLIEFGSEEEVKGARNTHHHDTTPVPCIDPFQHPLTATTLANTKLSSSSMSDGVVFDIWGSLSPTEINGGSRGGSTALPTPVVGDMLGLGISDHTHNSHEDACTFGEEKSNTRATEVSSSSDLFDPVGNASADIFGIFDSVHSNGIAISCTNGGSVSASSSIKQLDAIDATFNLMGDPPMLVPVVPKQSSPPSSSSPVPPSFTVASTTNGIGTSSRRISSLSQGTLNNQTIFELFTPSSSTISSSVPQEFSKKHGPPIFKNTLYPEPSLNVSHSYPNLSLAGQQLQQHMNGGKLRGTGDIGGTLNINGVLGRSSSQNTSPMRTPSPVAQSRSSENLSRGARGQQQTKIDPFGQFTLKTLSDQGQGAAGRNEIQPTSSRHTVTAHSTGMPPTGNVYRPFYMQNQSNSGTSVGGVSHSRTTSAQPHATAGSQRLATGTKPKLAASSAFQPRSQSPNYHLSFSSVANSKTGIPSKPKEDAFSDLLGSGFNPKKGESESKTLKDMKSKTSINNALDPDRARVAAWADKKERNIRAIISSLHEVLWEGEGKWQEVGMHQLVQPDQVKKFYRRACLSVHPDKAQGANHEKLARAIFDELNDSYAKFEESGARPLY